MRNNMNDFVATGMFVLAGLKLASLEKTVADNEAIAADYPPVLYLDPNGGAKDVLLPAEATAKGLTFIVRNIADAAETLTLKDDSDTTTVVALAQNATAIVHCNGTVWRQIK